MSKRLFLLDDDAPARRTLVSYLERAGYQVDTASTMTDGLAIVGQRAFDLILLSLDICEMDGMEALRRLLPHHIPVMLLSGRGRPIDEIVGLGVGADDFVHKPFSQDVLLSRVKVVLRRAERGATTRPTPTTLEVGDLVIDQASHTVTVGGERVELPPRTFALLQALAAQPGHVLSVDDLLARTWGAGFFGEPQVVYVHVRWLREKLEADPARPRRIIAVRGLGYKLVACEDACCGEGPAGPSTYLPLEAPTVRPQ